MEMFIFVYPAASTRWTPFGCHFVLLSFCLIFASVGTGALHFIGNSPPSIRRYTGLNASIDCTTDDPNATVTLLHFGEERPLRENKIVLNEQVFTVLDLTVSDFGPYKCKATSQSGSSHTMRNNIFVIVLKEKIPCCPTLFPESKVLLSGEDANFTCRVNLQENDQGKYLIFKWYKEEGNTFVEVPADETSRFNDSSSVLMIRNAKATPEGGILYKCKMWYKGRPSYFDGPRLHVHRLSNKPANISELKPDSVVVNETTSLGVTCKAHGNPPPKITWLRNGMQLPVCVNNCVNEDYQASEGMNKEWAYTKSYLRINRTKYPRDHGTYTCKAENSVTDTKSVKVSIQTKPVLEKPSTFWPSDHVPCVVNHSNPLPTFHWQFQDFLCLQTDLGCEPFPNKWQDVPANFTVYPPVAMATNKSTLSIPTAFPLSFFRCTVKNVMGSDDWSLAYFANGEGDPIKLMASADKYDVGQTLELHCMFLWNESQIDWYKDNQRVTSANDTRMSISQRAESNGIWTQLLVERLKANDTGMYSCSTQDARGRKWNASKFITVRIADPPVSYFRNKTQILSEDAVIGISVVAGIIFLLLLVAIAGIYHQRQEILKYRSQFLPEFLEEPQIDPDRSLFEQSGSLPYDPVWEFPEERLILGEVIGSGAFGQVIKAEAVGITEFNPRNNRVENVSRLSKMFRSNRRYVELVKGMPRTVVAVKTLKDKASKEEYRDLASELKILIHVGQHKNIVNLLGACTKLKRGDRLLVILEYAPHGSLRDFLLSKRHIYVPVWASNAADPEQEFNIAHLVSYSYQICRGMEFLASKKCIHRDLAARNVLVGEDYVVKISDFGLAKDVYKNDLYVKTTDGFLPVKWMALESLFLKKYSEKSDVWSFGVCLWEIFTLGDLPYSEIPIGDLQRRLSEGYRMESPQECPAEIYAVMQDCWREEVDQRPTFAQLFVRIGQMMERRVSKPGHPAYISFTEEENGNNSSDYYRNQVASDSCTPEHEDGGYRRVSSEDISPSPTLSLPSVTNNWELESDESQRMLEPKGGGSLSENESGIELEENGHDLCNGVMEMRPMTPCANGKARRKLKSKQTFL
ncbi:vascular endothelial growth factor receptor 1-like isoform X1 [Montipora capricornis]|uniref:vascular endothelial growth factor receptor 1-like isoform X1 n=1 Tax=Montipora capricornis TaxID=246305 RepID=UPI0035F20E0D